MPGCARFDALVREPERRFLDELHIRCSARFLDAFADAGAGAPARDSALG